MERKIFGRDWSDIHRMQQGKPVQCAPSADRVNFTCSESDVDLLMKYGEQKLRDVGYYGVLDRLQRAGILAEG